MQIFLEACPYPPHIKIKMYNTIHGVRHKKRSRLDSRTNLLLYFLKIRVQN